MNISVGSVLSNLTARNDIMDIGAYWWLSSPLGSGAGADQHNSVSFPRELKVKQKKKRKFWEMNRTL
jgi:hypothetical protein